MATYAFDIYPAADPAGKETGLDTAARLVRLTVDGQLVSGYYKHVGFGLGEGQIQIHTDHADATETNIAKRNYVMFVFVPDTGPEQQIGGFFLEDGDFDALSRRERGGRILSFGGPGGLYMLDRYVLGHSVYAIGQSHRGDYDIPGMWTWSQEPYGAMLLRAIEEGRDHPDGFLAPLTMDFTRTRDSNDLLWTELEDYETPIGTSVLELYTDFLRLGLVVQATGYLLVQCYRDIDEFRTDRTSATFTAGKARFAAGVNILNDMPRRLAPSQERTHVLVRDRIGDYETIDEDLDLNPLGGVPYMTYLKSDTTADDDAIRKMGRLHLTRRKQYADQAVVRHIIGSGTGQYAPGPEGDYWVLDLVTLHTGTGQHDFNETAIEVASIKYYHDDAGNWFAETELGAQYIPPQTERFQRELASTIRNIQTVRLCASEPGIIEMDATWKTLNIAGSSAPDHWNQPGFDDSAWSAPDTVYTDISTDFRLVSGPVAQQEPSDEILIRKDFWIHEDDLTGSAVTFKYGADNAGRFYVNGVEVASLLPLFDGTDGTHYTSDHSTTIARSSFRAGLNCVAIYITNEADGSSGNNPPGSVAGGVYINMPTGGTGETGEHVCSARGDHPHHASGIGEAVYGDVQSAIFAHEDAITSLGSPGVNVHDLLTAERFIVGAHRGDVNETDGYPENTLEGMRQAALKGAHWIEMDVRKSADGTYYLMHDATVTRTTDGTGNVSDKTDAQMDALNVDGGLGYDSGRHGTTLNVPTLESVLEALWPYDVIVQFDNKVAAEAGPLTEFIIAQGWEHRAAVNAYTIAEREDIEAASDNVLVVGGATNQQRGVETPAYSDIVDLAYVTSRIPKIVLGLIPDTEYGDPLDFAAIAEDMFDRGARGLVSHDIDTVLAWWRSYGITAGAAALDDLSDVAIDSPATGDLMRYDGAEWVNVTETSAVEGAGRWEPITHNPGSGPEIMFDGDDILVTFVET